MFTTSVKKLQFPWNLIVDVSIDTFSETDIVGAATDDAASCFHEFLEKQKDMSNISQLEFDVIRMYYVDNISITKIAKKLNYSPSRISQLRKKVIECLRDDKSIISIQSSAFETGLRYRIISRLLHDKKISRIPTLNDIDIVINYAIAELQISSDDVNASFNELYQLISQPKFVKIIECGLHKYLTDSDLVR